MQLPSQPGFAERPIFQHSGFPETPTSGESSNRFGDLDSFLKGLGLKDKDLDKFLRAAVGESLRGQDTLLNELQGFGEGARAGIEQDFTTSFNNLLGSAELRGLGGSSLVPTAGLGLEREKQRTLGDLNDTLLGRRLDILGQGSSSLASLFAGAGQQSIAGESALALQKQQAKLGNLSLKSAPNPARQLIAQQNRVFQGTAYGSAGRI